jgi:hypothetical protein
MLLKIPWKIDCEGRAGGLCGSRAKCEFSLFSFALGIFALFRLSFFVYFFVFGVVIAIVRKKLEAQVSTWVCKFSVKLLQMVYTA